MGRKVEVGRRRGGRPRGLKRRRYKRGRVLSRPLRQRGGRGRRGLSMKDMKKQANSRGGGEIFSSSARRPSRQRIGAAARAPLVRAGAGAACASCSGGGASACQQGLEEDLHSARRARRASARGRCAGRSCRTRRAARARRAAARRRRRGAAAGGRSGDGGAAAEERGMGERRGTEQNWRDRWATMEPRPGATWTKSLNFFQVAAGRGPRESYITR